MPRNGLFSFSGTADPVDLAAHDLVVVVGALRPAEDDGAAVLVRASSGSVSPNRGRRTSSGMPRLSQLNGRRGRGWKAPRAGRSEPGWAWREKIMALKESWRKTRQSACQSTPIRLTCDCKTAQRNRCAGTGLVWPHACAEPVHSVQLVQALRLTLPGVELRQQERRAAPVAAPASPPAGWPSPAPPAAGRASARDSRPRRRARPTAASGHGWRGLGDAGARLELGRHRARAQAGDADAARLRAR